MEHNPYTPPEASVADVRDGLILARTHRYYTPWQIVVATIVGGSLAGGLLALRNHIVFGAKRKAIFVLFVSIFVLIGSIVVGIIMPPHAIRSLGALLIAGAYRWYAEAAFAGRIARAKAAGWEQHSWWRAIGISAAIFACILVIFLLGIFVFGREALP